ncbi:MAG: dihydrofolate synthase/folylpolyglutamate synthase [Bradymonadia bacterium]
MAVITNIGLDHLETLGPSLEQIAWHKAGIAAHAAHVVTTQRASESLALIERECSESGATLAKVAWRRSDVGGDVGGAAEVSLGGHWVSLGADCADHQAANAAAALVTVEWLARRHGFDLPPVRLDRLFSDGLPGRFEIVQESPRVILDGAHNIDKVTALVAQFQREYPGVRATVAFGVLARKSPESLIRLLEPIAERFIALTPRSVGKPALGAADVQALVSRVTGMTCTIGEGTVLAVERWMQEAKPSQTLIVTGSMYLVGEVRTRWFPIDRLI